MKQKKHSAKESTRQTVKQIDLAQLTEQLYLDGHCCSESLVIAATESYAPDISNDLALSAATGLCGGMGSNQATCGVFTGGAVAISLVLGQGNKKDKRIKDLSAQYHQKLQQHAGGHVCQQLLGKMGLSNWNGSGCRHLTKDGAVLLQSILEPELKIRKNRNL